MESLQMQDTSADLHLHVFTHFEPWPLPPTISHHNCHKLDMQPVMNGRACQAAYSELVGSCGSVAVAISGILLKRPQKAYAANE